MIVDILRNIFCYIIIVASVIVEVIYQLVIDDAHYGKFELWVCLFKSSSFEYHFMPFFLTTFLFFLNFD
jgi:hypothetical protein